MGNIGFAGYGERRGSKRGWLYNVVRKPPINKRKLNNLAKRIDSTHYKPDYRGW